MKISAVIPTKNRPHDLLVAVRSITRQTRTPDQLIIVDQSDDMFGQELIRAELQCTPEIELIYVHDPLIAGLVAAKAESIKFATGDVICFLEDDVVLEEDYIHQIEAGFLGKPAMLGCSGVITNPPLVSRLYLLTFQIFHRGIYSDNRPAIFARINNQSSSLIPSDVLSGGLSAWRREVFEEVHFDVSNGFHMLEDFEFSRRAFRCFGSKFFINPNARLEHNCSPINRAFLDLRHKRKVVEFITYYKKNRQLPFALASLLWLMVGQCIDAFAQSINVRSFKPVFGVIRGVCEGVGKRII